MKPSSLTRILADGAAPLYRLTIPLRLVGRGLLARLTHRLYEWSSERRGAAPTGGKRILVVARDALALTHAEAFIERFAAEADWAFHITGPSRLLTRLRSATPRRLREVPSIGFLQALRRPWDLVCFPSHHHAGLFHPSIPRVFTAHGLDGGRIIYGGAGYTYGWKAMADRRRCAYDGFLATSQNERRLAGIGAGGTSPFDGRILITTEPVALKLLEARERAPAKDPRGRPSVIIMSTWVRGSVLDRHGRRLLEHVGALGRDFDVRISVHPRAYGSAKIRGLIADFTALGVEIVRPSPEAWIPALLAADVAVGDISAMSLYYSLLGRPILFVAGAPLDVLPTSPLLELARICPQLDLARDVSSQLKAALGSGLGAAVRNFSATTFPHIGDAERLRDFLRGLMRTAGTALEERFHGRVAATYCRAHDH